MYKRQSYNSKTELDVYLNGIRLASDDFTATSGTTVVLAVGASVNDTVDIVSTGDGVSFRSTTDASGDRFTLNNVGIGTDQTPDKLNVRGNVNVVGVVTATTLHGDGSNLTGLAADKVFEGNTEVETVDTGSNGHIKFTTEGVERARIDSDGHILIGGTSSRSVGFAHELQLEGTATTPHSISNISNRADAHASHIDFAKTRGSSFGSTNIVQDDDFLGHVIFRGSDGTDLATQS